MDNLYFLEIEDELQEQKDKVVQLLRSVLAKKTFAYRGDYTTFFRYALVLLTGDTEGFQFDKPTSVSKARWMGKTNYASALVLLKDKLFEELPRNLIMTEQHAVQNNNQKVQHP